MAAAAAVRVAVPGLGPPPCACSWGSPQAPWPGRCSGPRVCGGSGCGWSVGAGVGTRGLGAGVGRAQAGGAAWARRVRVGRLVWWGAGMVLVRGRLRAGPAACLHVNSLRRLQLAPGCHCARPGQARPARAALLLLLPCLLLLLLHHHPPPLRPCLLLLPPPRSAPPATLPPPQAGARRGVTGASRPSHAR
jgi:hypothetical protein